MAIGDYTKTTYVNGTTPARNATNLNNQENKTDELDAEAKRIKNNVLRKIRMKGLR